MIQPWSRWRQCRRRRRLWSVALCPALLPRQGVLLGAVLLVPASWEPGPSQAVPGDPARGWWYRRAWRLRLKGPRLRWFRLPRWCGRRVLRGEACRALVRRRLPRLWCRRLLWGRPRQWERRGPRRWPEHRRCRKYFSIQRAANRPINKPMTDMTAIDSRWRRAASIRCVREPPWPLPARSNSLTSIAPRAPALRDAVTRTAE